MKNTYVYFIKERLGIHAPVKIGLAKNIEKRFEALQIGNPRQLELVAKIGPVSRKRAECLEWQLHRKFRKHHLRGEWFSGVILKYMNKIREEVIVNE